MRSLSVGFYHAMGNADDLEENYNAAGYRFLGKNLYGADNNPKGGSLQWRPREINGPTRAEADYIGIGGDVSTGRGGGATWSENGLDGESIKKDILPTVAFHRRGNLAKLWQPPGRLGWGDATDPFERAKSYVWKQMNGPSGWERNDPPEDDSWGFSADYLNLIRERSKYSDKRQAAQLLTSFMQSVGVQNLGLGGLSADSEQEALIRLMPYLRQYIDAAGRVSLTHLQQAVQTLGTTPGEERGGAYDLQRSMRGFEDIEDAIEANIGDIVGDFDGLADFLEITEIDQRIIGKLAKDVDLRNKNQRDALAGYMERQLNAALQKSYQRGSALTSTEDRTFAGQATRRMERVFNNSGTLRHTWLEPVAGGIGLYNVVAPYGGSATVHVSFLPTQIDLTRLATGIASKSRVSRLKRQISNATYNTGFAHSRIQYGATSLKTLMGALAGDTSSFEGRQSQTGILRTRGVVMTEGDLTNEVFRFVTGVGLALERSEAAATMTQHSSGFHDWAQGAVSQIARYGQHQANNLVTDSYQSWVRDRLTVGRQRGEDGTEQQYEYGDGTEQWSRRFDMNRLYQPKPFLWLERRGVAQRTDFRVREATGVQGREGPFK